jgi:hypothetical protein
MIVGQDGGPLPTSSDDVAMVERASASPATVDLQLAHPSNNTVVVAEPALPLEALQHWFTIAMTDEARHTDENDVARRMTAGPQLSALSRLHIYRHAYQQRLIDCLVDDYPAVRTLLGQHAFEAAAKRYMASHPSRHPNLTGFGRHFPSTLSGMAADVATMEWAIVELIHAAPSPVADLSALATMTPEQTQQLRFTPSSTLRFLTFSHRANACLQAIRDGSPLPTFEPSWSATAVYRLDWRIWRMDFTAPMAGVLSALLAGIPLGQALSSLPSTNSATEGDVSAWFRAWVSSGFFATIGL